MFQLLIIAILMEYPYISKYIVLKHVIVSAEW
jgi:hypothetical protein